MDNFHILEKIFIKLHLSWIVPIFLREKCIYIQNKHKGKKTKTHKVNDTKTVESIKYKPILS